MNEKILPYLDSVLPETGSFVEVGGYDGETHSMTARLADKGWKGIYVEPIPVFAAKCRERHKDNDVQVLETAVGDGNPTILHVRGELTSSKGYVGDVANKYPVMFDYENEGDLVVSTKKLKDLVDKPDFLVIDVEGMEWEVLQHAPEAPVIAIELHKGSELWQQPEALQNASQCEEWLLEHGYKRGYEDDINSVFIK